MNKKLCPQWNAISNYLFSSRELPLMTYNSIFKLETKQKLIILFWGPWCVANNNKVRVSYLFGVFFFSTVYTVECVFHSEFCGDSRNYNIVEELCYRSKNISNANNLLCGFDTVKYGFFGMGMVWKGLCGIRVCGLHKYHIVELKSENVPPLIFQIIVEKCSRNLIFGMWCILFFCFLFWGGRRRSRMWCLFSRIKI